MRLQLLQLLAWCAVSVVLGRRSIAWTTYDPKHLQEDCRLYYKLASHAVVPVPMSHADHYEQSKETRGRTLDIYVRRFSATPNPTRHIWFVAGGPGISTSGIERAMTVELPDTAIYLMDNRGLGQSQRMCTLAESPLCANQPAKCYSRLAYPPQVISLHETAQDYNYISRLILGTDGGEIYMYGSSYGSTLTYRAFQFNPHLYSGILLEVFTPESSLHLLADIRFHVADSCLQSEQCRDRFPLKTRDEIAGLVGRIMDPGTQNACKRGLQFVSPHIAASLHGTIDIIVRSLAVRKFHERALMLPFLYSVAYCPSVDRHNALLGQVCDAVLERATDKHSTGKLTRMHEARDAPSNTFFQRHIRFSEMTVGAGEMLARCQRDGYLDRTSWVDPCGMIYDYRASFEPYLYRPVRKKPTPQTLRTSTTRVIVVSGRWDTQTPYDAAREEFDQLEVPEKYMFVANHMAHGVIGASGFDLSLGKMLSFLMHGNKGELQKLRRLFARQNADVDHLWKRAFEKRREMEQGREEDGAWSFTIQKRHYSWEAFGMVLLGTFAPPIITLYGFFWRNDAHRR